MADEEWQDAKENGFMRTMTKRALAPIVATAATAVTGYAIRKGAEVWEQELRPKIAEKGGGRALARETLGHAAATVSGAVESARPLSEKMSSLSETVRSEQGAGADVPSDAPERSVNDAERKAERQRREQRRQERRHALEQAKSS
ncbi:MAG TPA: hypothetical protein VLD16_07760 [Gaiellaceae bacterium]|nr:hypothetical protein [Gaiellaceae bacterium]